MNKSDKVLLYGSLFSIAFIVACVYFHKDKVLKIEKRKSQLAHIESINSPKEPVLVTRVAPPPKRQEPIFQTPQAEEQQQQIEELPKVVEEESITESMVAEDNIQNSNNQVVQDEIENILNIQAQITDILNRNRISFYRGSSNLRLESKKTLDEISKLLKELPDIQIVVKGYTDASGSRAKNKALSLKRANAVKRYLEQKGFNPDTIEAIGYGEEDLIDEKNPYSAVNRRVEIEIRR